jgi:hypothetical protein
MMRRCNYYFDTVVPEIDFPPEDYEYTTIQFMDTVFECNATGIPAPTIQFFLDGSLLESNETFSILDPVNEVIDVSGEGDLVHLVTRRLLISPTLDGDSNNYTCVATNDNGTDSVEFELVVFGKPHTFRFSNLPSVYPFIDSQLLL